LNYWFRPGAGDYDLEMPKLRETIKDIFQRLFPEDLPLPVSDEDQAAGVSASTLQEEELTYQQKLTRLFDADLLKKDTPTSQVNLRKLLVRYFWG
jgi:hypothetical protein